MPEGYVVLYDASHIGEVQSKVEWFDKVYFEVLMEK